MMGKAERRSDNDFEWSQAGDHHYLLSIKTKPWDFFLGITWANWLTTLLFCMTHLVTRSLLVASLVIIPSLLLGALRDKGFSIRALAAIHLYWNGGVYLLIGIPSS